MGLVRDPLVYFCGSQCSAHGLIGDPRWFQQYLAKYSIRIYWCTHLVVPWKEKKYALCLVTLMSSLLQVGKYKDRILRWNLKIEQLLTHLNKACTLHIITHEIFRTTYKVGADIIPILHMRKWRHWEFFSRSNSK